MLRKFQVVTISVTQGKDNYVLFPYFLLHFLRHYIHEMSKNGKDKLHIFAPPCNYVMSHYFCSWLEVWIIPISRVSRIRIILLLFILQQNANNSRHRLLEFEYPRQSSALSWVFKFYWQSVPSIVCVCVFFGTLCMYLQWTLTFGTPLHPNWNTWPFKKSSNTGTLLWNICQPAIADSRYDRHKIKVFRVSALVTGHYLWLGGHRREKGWVNKILSVGKRGLKYNRPSERVGKIKIIFETTYHFQKKCWINIFKTKTMKLNSNTYIMFSIAYLKQYAYYLLWYACLFSFAFFSKLAKIQIDLINPQLTIWLLKCCSSVPPPSPPRHK